MRRSHRDAWLTATALAALALGILWLATAPRDNGSHADVVTVPGRPAQVSPISLCVTVGFDLNKPAAIKIVIRDASGAIVKRLDNADHPAGLVLKRWGEMQDSGLPAPHGAYTALITATTVTELTSASIPFTIS